MKSLIYELSIVKESYEKTEEKLFKTKQSLNETEKKLKDATEKLHSKGKVGIAQSLYIMLVSLIAILASPRAFSTSSL